MVAIDSCTISGQHIEFTPFIGIIEDVQNWSTTQVWSEGGGGYVPPQYGGYVQAPTVHSRSTHHVRIRVAWEGGRRSSIDLPGHIQFSRGDHVIFIAGVNKQTQIWQWVGVVNITVENWCVVGAMADVVKMKANSIFDNIGAFCLGIVSRGGNAIMGVIILSAFISFLLASPINDLLSTPYNNDHFVTSFWIAATLIGVLTIVPSVRLLSRVKTLEEYYKTFRVNLLQKSLKRGLTLSRPNVEAAPA